MIKSYESKAQVLNKGKFDRNWLVQAVNKSRSEKDLEARLIKKGMEFTYVSLETNKDDRCIWDVFAESGCVRLQENTFGQSVIIMHMEVGKAR
jgi:hypothetical protein